jgi:hypothetical protein
LLLVIIVECNAILITAFRKVNTQQIQWRKQDL